VSVTIADRSGYIIDRHGVNGEIAPHRVNYRANLWLLREAGVTEVIALNTVGGIDPRFIPGSVVIPDQIIDYTWGRESSYEDPTVAECHPEFTMPFDSSLRVAILSAAGSAGLSAHNGAVYGVTQGPRLETAAEIDRLERDGCDIVGMTAMPEAILARELGLRYAMVCGVVNYAAGSSICRATPGLPAGDANHIILGVWPLG
jgi:purine nucleoside phosphorylase